MSETMTKRARLTAAPASAEERRRATHQAQRNARAARLEEQLRQRAALKRAHAPEAARLAAEALALVRALMALEETMQEAEPSASFCDDNDEGGSLEAAEHILDAVRRAALSQ